MRNKTKRRELAAASSTNLAAGGLNGYGEKNQAVVHMPNPQFAMEKQLIVSRQQGGPYTIDELEEDYDYSEICLCTPFKFFVFLLVVAGLVLAGLYGEGVLGPKQSKSSGNSAGVTSTAFLTTFIPADGSSGSGGEGNSSDNNDDDDDDSSSAVLDALPDPLPITSRKTSQCDPSACVLPDCNCLGQTTPPRDLPVADVPQIVMLTFDDGITNEVFPFFERIFRDRKNPNGCPATSTFFVSHRFTNYRLVQELYHSGHEIGSHSITHATIAEWEDEILGQREIINNFAFIPQDQVTSFRAPFLQPGGDEQFIALARNGFNRDSTLLEKDYANPPMFPYTLDWIKSSTCVVSPCPEQYSYEGLWEFPVTPWQSVDGSVAYGMADEYSPSSKAEALEYFRHNFNRHFNENRAPFNMYMHAAWFERQPHVLEALIDFLDEIQGQDEVFMVSQAKALEWMQTPVSLDRVSRLASWGCDQEIKGPKPCKERNAQKCVYNDPVTGNAIVMETCAEKCPKKFPWVGNPDGSK